MKNMWSVKKSVSVALKNVLEACMCEIPSAFLTSLLFTNMSCVWEGGAVKLVPSHLCAASCVPGLSCDTGRRTPEPDTSLPLFLFFEMPFLSSFVPNSAVENPPDVQEICARLSLVRIDSLTTLPFALLQAVLCPG